MAGDVLLLDDDQDLLDALGELIGLMTGRLVQKVRSFAELATLGPAVDRDALAILDVNLGPDAPSGVDAARWLRERKFPGRIVFLTGHAHGSPVVRQAQALGDIPVMTKPLRPEQLRVLLGGST
jgi:FixJ family two-component response regulator